MSKVTKLTMYFIWIIVFLSIIIASILLSKANHADYSDLYSTALDYYEDNYTSPDSGKDGFKLFYEYEVLGSKEKNNNIYIYMWIYDSSYYVDKGEVINSESSSMFYKFTIKNNKVVKYEIPKDGSEYTKSVEDMCNDYYLARKVLNFEVNDYNMPSKLQSKVDDYYNKYLEEYNAELEELTNFQNMINKIIILSNYAYLNDRMFNTKEVREINGIKIYEYNIATDLGLDSVGNFKGKVVVYLNGKNSTYLIALTNGKYYTVNNKDNPESYYMVYDESLLENNIVEGNVSEINDITEIEFALFN